MNEIVKKNGYDIDMVGMIVKEVGSIYRQVKNVDVSIVATYFDGKGHFSAGSNPLENEKFKKMLEENRIE